MTHFHCYAYNLSKYLSMNCKDAFIFYSNLPILPQKFLFNEYISETNILLKTIINLLCSILDIYLHGSPIKQNFVMELKSYIGLKNHTY